MKKLLAFIDCQNDFIDGTMAVGYEKWNKAYDRIIKLLRENTFDGYIFTADMHPVSHCSFKEQGGIWPVHCVDGSYGSDIFWKLRELKDCEKSLFIEKGKDPAVEEYGVDLLADDCDYDEDYEIYLVGLCYDYCVSECAKMTAKRHSNSTVYVIKDATVAIDDSVKVDWSNYSNVKEI